MWTSHKDKNSVLVVIPAYNEAKNLKHAVDKLIAGCPYDYLIVNDASLDETEELCQAQNYNYISHKKNQGLSEAMRTGFKYAWERGYSYVVQYDGDGQHNPDDVVKLVEYIQQHPELDIVSGSRFLDGKNTKHESFAKEMGRSLLSYSFYKRTKARLTDPTNGLRVFSKRFIDMYCFFKKFEVEPSTVAYVIVKKNMKIAELPVVVNDRLYGTSTFDNIFKVVAYMGKQFRRFWFTTRKWKY